jgi:hypothetical protein
MASYPQYMMEETVYSGLQTYLLKLNFIEVKIMTLSDLAE